MAENLIRKLLPHQGCVITPIDEGIQIAGSAMNWVMSAAVAPFLFRPPLVFRVVGKTDSTNLRMHFHRGELIFNWECNVRELRVHDPQPPNSTACRIKASSPRMSGMKSFGRSGLTACVSSLTVRFASTEPATIPVSSPRRRSVHASAAQSRFVNSPSRRSCDTPAERISGSASCRVAAGWRSPYPVPRRRYPPSCFLSSPREQSARGA